MITVLAYSFPRLLKPCLLPSSEPGEAHKDQPPVLLLHGFDSSSLEFRRLLPLLEKKLETWAVDLVGWGFSDSGAATRTDMRLGPQQKRDHLYAFWKEKVMLAFAVLCDNDMIDVDDEDSASTCITVPRTAAGS